MAFADKYKITGTVLDNNSMILEGGEAIIDERIEISADAFAIGETVDYLINKLEELRIAII